MKNNVFVDYFVYIKTYINRLNNNIDKLNIKSYTYDLDIGLIRAFDLVFNKDKKIRHIGCYFHYLQKSRKYIQKKIIYNFKMRNIYNLSMNFCKT